MKRLILSALLLLAATGAASAQKCMVIDSEKVFKSLAEYNGALEQIDALAKSCQAEVDRRFDEVEQLYNSYMAQKGALTAAARQVREETILRKEQEAAEYQRSLFDSDGMLMKRRIELIQPIQERVFAVIGDYAEEHGYDLVLDSAGNPSLLYFSPGADRTQQIIETLKR